MKIGIIGASSQVGSSLAFYFKHFTEHEPVCFVRSVYSQVFFQIAGIEYKNVSLNDTQALRDSFADMDVVIDCTYPAGQLYEIPQLIRKNLDAIFSALPAKCAFIYMSTIMAYGMPTGHKKVEHFSVPRTTYAFIKRRTEAMVNRMASARGIKAFNFRLGQVHGFLQSVNGSYREKLSYSSDSRIDGNKDDKVNIIFISTLAKAIIKASQGEIKPGLYSLVNHPQWTLSELYDYYGKYYGFERRLNYQPEHRQKKSLKGYLFGLARQYRPLVESYFLVKRASLYQKVKGKYRVNDVAGTIGDNTSNNDALLDFHLLGENPGPFISGIGSNWQSMLEEEKKMEASYEACLKAVTK